MSKCKCPKCLKKIMDLVVLKHFEQVLPVCGRRDPGKGEGKGDPSLQLAPGGARNVIGDWSTMLHSRVSAHSGLVATKLREVLLAP